MMELGAETQPQRREDYRGLCLLQTRKWKSCMGGWPTWSSSRLGLCLGMEVLP